MPATKTTTEDSESRSPRDDDPFPTRPQQRALLLILAALLSPFACDSVELLSMRGTSSGRVESVAVRRGGHGTSAPVIEYSYTVDGRRHVSDRFAPGFFAKGTWTGGGGVASDYRVEQSVQVHYDPRHPERACLAYGWHPWTLALPLFILGMALQGWASRWRGRRGLLGQAAGGAMALLAMASIGLIHDVLHPSELPTALALSTAVFGLCLLYRRWKGPLGGTM